MKKFLNLVVITLLIFMMQTATTEAKQKNEDDSYKLQYLNLTWWENYNDPILNEHLKEIYTKNPDLKIASLKVKEGEKLVKISFANQLPQLSFDGTLNRNLKSSDLYFGALQIPSFKQSELQLPLTMSYEVDIWGTNRFRTKSIEKQLAMIQQDERAAFIALSSAFAAEYFNLVRIDKLVETQQKIVDTQRQIVEKTNIKFQNGLATQNDLLNEEKALTYFQEDLNNLVDKQAVLIHELRVYLSINDDTDIKRTKYEKLEPLKNLPEKMSSDVITQRPDYLRAEHNIKRVGYDVKVAKREFLPKFLIFGQVGFNAYQFNKLFSSPAQMASAGILPQLDIFDGGRKFAILKLKKYEYDEALQIYQKTILTSWQELNDSIGGAITAQRNYNASIERIKYENHQLALLDKKANIGAAAPLDVLYGKERQLLTEKDEISNKVNLIISSINIYKAIGGRDIFAVEKENI